MTVFTLIQGVDASTYTTLTPIARRLGMTGNALRIRFSRAKSDVITVKGWKIYRTTLERIRGRGRRSFR
jgi:hypothetical protein